MVVSLLGDVPKRTQPGKIGELMAWQDANRRRSLLQIGKGPLTWYFWCCCFCSQTVCHKRLPDCSRAESTGNSRQMLP